MIKKNTSDDDYNRNMVTYYVLDTEPSTLHEFSYLILLVDLGDMHDHYSHLAIEKLRLRVNV